MGVNGRASRRTVLLGAGAVGAAGVLAACGADDPGGAQQAAAEPPGDGGTPPGEGGATPLAGAAGAGIPVAHVPVGGGFIDFEHRVVVTQPEAGQFRAFDANCTHERCLITWVEDGLLKCPCHGSQFRIADGSVAQGPATQPLPGRTATVDGEFVIVS